MKMEEAMSLTELKTLVKSIQGQIDTLPLLETDQNNSTEFTQKINQLIFSSTNCAKQVERIENEYFGWGPITHLLCDESVTEIIICDLEKIFYERNGCLFSSDEQFLSNSTFRIFLRRLCHECGTELSIVAPFLQGKMKDFRVHITCEPITAFPTIHLRRVRTQTWNTLDLVKKGMLTNIQSQIIFDLVKSKKNILVVGPTGSGKTTILNAILDEIPSCERIIIIEDVSELIMPNSCSTKLLTRQDPQEKFPTIDQAQLVKQSLRMRPDRIVVGEVRGAEAKDLILALSTGHSGSIGTLHADGPNQALMRLEMLVSLGAPQWKTETIRQMIKYGLDAIIVVKRNKCGKRAVESIHKIASLENFGITTEQIDSGYSIEN